VLQCYWVKRPFELWRSARNFDPSRPAFQGYPKVIGTDTDRLATYDFTISVPQNWAYLDRTVKCNLQDFPTPYI